MVVIDGRQREREREKERVGDKWRKEEEKRKKVTMLSVHCTCY